MADRLSAVPFCYFDKGRRCPLPFTDRQLVLRHAAGIVLAVALAVTAHRDRQPLGQGVDAGHAHAVQAAGDLVAVVVELAAGVQFGHDHLHRGHAFLGMDVHGDAAAVVAHGDAVVGVQDDGDAGAEAGHGLVDGVVHHFVHQMFPHLFAMK